MSYSTNPIRVGARSSPLSIVQVQEVLILLHKTDPTIRFETLYLKTTGDLDQKTSLRHLDKTDFFSKELDQKVLDRAIDIAIHSAKDLPDPLPKGLVIAALTQGIDPSDALVLRSGDTLTTLPKGAKIATSSDRREASVKALRGDLTFVDIRGPIEARLEQLHSQKVDGVVIAEAALIRLQLTHLNRMILPGETVPGQGKLAVVCSEDDHAMKHLMSVIDAREDSLLRT